MRTYFDYKKDVYKILGITLKEDKSKKIKELEKELNELKKNEQHLKDQSSKYKDLYLQQRHEKQ